MEQQYWELVRNVKLESITRNMNQNLHFNQICRWFGLEKYYFRRLVSFPDINFNGLALFSNAPLSSSHHDAISCLWKQKVIMVLHIYYLLYHLDLSLATVIIGSGTVKIFFPHFRLTPTYSSSSLFIIWKLGFIFSWSDIFHGSLLTENETPYNLTPAFFLVPSSIHYTP